LVRILFQTEEIKSITSTESKTTFIYAQLFALILLVSMLFISPISDRLKNMASQVADKDVYIQTILANKIQGDAS